MIVRFRSLITVVVALAALGAGTGCMGSLFPRVEPVSEPGQSSLIAIEAVIHERDPHGNLSDHSIQLFTSGFYPVITGPDGAEMALDMFDASARGGTYWFKGNVAPGTYTVTGFRYLWMTQHDFLHTPIKDLGYDGQSEAAWVQRQFFPLPEPVQVTVKPGQVVSLGRYSMTFATYGNAQPAAEDRRRCAEHVYTAIEPKNINVLQDMKHWRAGNWPAWNEYNPVTPAP